MISLLLHSLEPSLQRTKDQGSKGNLCPNKAKGKQQGQSRTTTTPQCKRKCELLGVRGAKSKG